MPWRIPLSLRAKLAIAFLLVLLPVLALVIYDDTSDYRLHEDMVLEGQMRTAQAVGSVLGATFDQGVAVGQAVAIDPVVRTFDPDRLDPYLARYLTLYPQYESINVWDASGQNVGASVSLPPGEPRPNIADREHFQRAMATGEPAVSEVMIARTTNRPTAAIVVPIMDEASRPLGAVSVLFNLDVLPQTLQEMRLAPGQAILVADRTGTLALHTLKPDLTWEERDASQYQPISEALSRGQFSGIVPGLFTQGPHMVSVSRTPRYGWVAGVSMPESEALGGLRRQATATLVGYLGVVLVAGLLALGLTFAITHPLRDLIRTIAAFGRGELGRRVEVRTGDELETTAEAFNRMASALQREQDRLRFLVEMGTALTSALEVNRVVQLLAERMTEVLGEASWVCLLPGEEQRCRVMIAYTRDRAIGERLLALFRQHDEWVTANLSRPVVHTGEPILIRDVASSQMEEGLRRGLVELGATSWMVVPLRARGHTLGIMASGSLSEERRFGEEELALAMDLAGRAGTVIDNALLFQQVQEERRRLQTILETVPVGVVVGEAPTGRILMASRAAEAILGRPLAPDLEMDRWQKEYGIFRPTGEPMPPEETPLGRTLRHGEVTVGVEGVVRQPSGREVYVLGHSAPLRDAEGRLVGGVVAFQDITPLKEAQRRMGELAREAERRRDELDAVIEGVSEGISIADGEGRIVRINSRGREILGVDLAPGETLPLREYARLIDLRYPDGRPMPPDEWPITRAVRGEVVSGMEALLVRRDGRRFSLLFSSGAVRDEKGRVLLAMSIYRDITPLREFERAREEFISVVAHDLRAPLTVITGFAGLLRRLPADQHGRPQEQKAIESILSSAKRLEKMVADLLDASRIEARRLKLELQPVELPELVHEVVDRTVELTRGHPVRVEVRGVVPRLEADPARLEQILTNLLSNAAKYSYPDSEILVEVEPRAEEVVVSVTNQGPGIALEDREEIFTRFHRTRAAAMEGVPGLGLGLYITKGLVEAHGGRIWVQSEPGNYATFRFTLPLPK